jgi:hypothetical protein
MPGASMTRQPVTNTRSINSRKPSNAETFQYPAPPAAGKPA